MNNIKKKRKIAFIITSFIHYSRNFLILDELLRNADVELHVVVGGSALIQKYTAVSANLKDLLVQDGHTNIHELYFHLEGDKRVAKAKTAGLGIIEFSTLFNDISPDLVIVRADRYEVLAATMAASYMNIPIAHIEGGDLTGTIDESVRHAITKLSQFHFTTNSDASERLVRMGENPKYVFNVGSPDIEVALKCSKVNLGLSDLSLTGSGTKFDINEDFLMVMYHPVWSDCDDEVIATNTREVLSVVHDLDYPTYWFWPNADIGAEVISHELRRFNDLTKEHRIRFTRYLSPRDFISLLSRTKVLVGNSSAGIKECSYLGVPVVNIGSRQNNRLRSDNVLDVAHNKKAIKRAVIAQLGNGKYESSDVYRARNTSAVIARKLTKVPLFTQKVFHE